MREIEAVAIAILMMVALLILATGRSASGGERIKCEATPERPIRTHWSWRANIDGQPDKCWFRGHMRPAEDLYWQQPTAEPLLMPVEVPMRPPWELEHRWVDPTGWTHRE